MFLQEIWDVIPAGEPRQYSPRMLIDSLRTKFGEEKISVLDLGCGDGRSIDWFADSGVNFTWKGLDIEASPEVGSRVRTDGEFHSYDGVNIPFDAEVFDVVFSNQVFEHVRHPEPLMREITRALKPGGLFIGSVSYLEPFHSYSLFNFTPYGWYTINVENGLKPTLLAGGIDAISLIERGLRREVPDDVWVSSPLNKEIVSDPELHQKQKSYKILMNAGHMVFSSMKPV